MPLLQARREYRPLGSNGTRNAAVIIATIAILCTACDIGATPSASTTVSARDYCREHEFIDGEQRNDAGELVAECSTGPTPNGGAYSIARYLDADGPADKGDATTVEISEHDDDGNVVHTTYGAFGGD